jgi:hypothetical protein
LFCRVRCKKTAINAWHIYFAALPGASEETAAR